MKSALYRSSVVHHRFEPVEHRFEYRIFMMSIDLSELDSLTTLRLFSRNRFNLFSFHDHDYIDHRAALREHGIREAPGREMLVTTPRVLGFGFNPVSFYFAWSADGEPLAAIAEVNNTFGETKPYVIGRDELTGKHSYLTERTKGFYISPFVPVDARLTIRMDEPGDELYVSVADTVEGASVLRATISGRREPLSDRRLLHYAIRYPLVSMKVVAAIHFQALRLWLKRVRFFRKNERIEEQVGLVPHRAREDR